MAAFEEAHGKPFEDLKTLELEERHLEARPTKCAKLTPEKPLPMVNAGQTLVIVFGGFLSSVYIEFFSLTCHNVSQVSNRVLTPHSWMSFVS
jgi:hypothetical protein